MNLYRLLIIESAGYDSVAGFVIACDSEEEARQVPFMVFLDGNHQGCRYECNHTDPVLVDEDEDEPQSPCVWKDPARSTCEVIGTAARGLPSGVVLRDFRAG